MLWRFWEKAEKERWVQECCCRRDQVGGDSTRQESKYLAWHTFLATGGESSTVLQDWAQLLSTGPAAT